ncbi:MAG: ribonuclease HI [Bacteroidetes bacterium]|nr:ribonuclease HI [Bacteroidota bacterium]
MNCVLSVITIYTDGAARGNPGPGGYGIILMYGQHRKEISKGYRLTTNNRMELLAVITALKALTKNSLPVHIYSDSQYVIKAVNEGWLNNWIKTNFKGGKKNADLWTAYYQLSKKFKITFHWVKGHVSNPFNNRCDELATTAADGTNLDVDKWYEENEYRKKE